jgi:uncharacterized repeat protein (TIGR01451 family)
MLRLRLGPLFVSVLCPSVILIGCGGGGSSSQPPPPTAIFSVTKSHVSYLPLNGSGQYSISVTNTGPVATSGAVTLTDSLPSGLTATAMSGTGWTCTVSSVSCNRSDTLSPNSGYPSITLTVSVGGTRGYVSNQVLVSGGGAPSAAASDPTWLGPPEINHVVIIFQENRTPDNLFQGLCTANGGVPGCGTGASQYDIASQGQTSTGQTVTLTPVADGLVTTYDLGHSHAAFLDACQYNSSTNGCGMNGQDLVPCSPIANCPNLPQFQYVPASYVQPYLTMAETYTFGDHMFQTNQGPSFPAHQYILSGTSAISASSTIVDADNPFHDARPDGTFWAGCLAPPGSEIYAIDTSNPNPTTPETTITQLCNEHLTLTDLLDTANLSWKYYAPMPGSIWTAPDAIQHMCVPSPPAAGTSQSTVCSGPDWTNADPNVVIEGSGAQIITDISNLQLAAVSWVIPTGAASDHADSNNGSGPSWVASIVNAVGQSQYWADTAIIVAWDDWGGWYDHVPPSSIRNSYEYGLRVPLIVISPYAKPAYISKVNHDFGSILKFAETVFSLGEIDPAVGYADSRSDDLSDCFDFSQTPLAFTPISAPQDAAHFLNDKSPPTPPDDD